MYNCNLQTYIFSNYQRKKKNSRLATQKIDSIKTEEEEEEKKKKQKENCKKKPKRTI